MSWRSVLEDTNWALQSTLCRIILQIMRGVILLYISSEKVKTVDLVFGKQTPVWSENAMASAGFVDNIDDVLDDLFT